MPDTVPPAQTAATMNALTILAGIEQFGLAADGADVRDLRVTIEEMSKNLAEAQETSSRRPEGQEPAPVELVDDEMVEIAAQIISPNCCWPDPPNAHQARRQQNARDKARAALEAALAGSGVRFIPAGFVVVPVEPTDEMVHDQGVDVGERTIRKAWATMLRRRPALPAPMKGPAE